jgi:hypothetical protein
MPQDRPIPGTPQDWLARAKSDLAFACLPLPEGAFHEDLCFHDPLSDSSELVRIHSPVAKLDQAKPEIVAARFYEIPVEAVRLTAEE